MNFFFILLTLISSLSLFAKSHEILFVTSSEDTDYRKLYIETDDEDFEVLSLNMKTFNKDHEKIDDQIFSYDEINDSGAVLSVTEGHDVVVIKKIQVKQSTGGKVSLELLSNAITGKKMQYDLKLQKNGLSWECIDLSKNRIITNMHLMARKILGKAVGIKTVVTN